MAHSHDSPKSKPGSQQAPKPPTPKEPEPYTLLFFSVDVSGSTELKNKLKLSKWMGLFSQFFERAVAEHQRLASEHSEFITASRIPWKCIGDEVISWYRLSTNEPSGVRDAVCKLIPSFLEATLALDKMIVESTPNESPGLHVGVKGAAWLALIDEKSNTEIELPPQKDSDENASVPKDFLGQHIDEGFRITGCTESRRLVLSFDLARLLSKDTAAACRLRLISFQNFRGIWGDRYYPIIWFDGEEEEFKDSIAYDESFRSPLLGDYEKRRSAPVGPAELSKRLDEIRQDVHRDAGLDGEDSWPWTEPITKQPPQHRASIDTLDRCE